MATECPSNQSPCLCCSKLGSQRFGGLAFNAFFEANKDKASVSGAGLGQLSLLPLHSGLISSCFKSEQLKVLPAKNRSFVVAVQPVTPCALMRAHRLAVLLCLAVPQMYRELGIVDPSSTLNHEQFTTLLSNIDKGLRALPATAQVGTALQPS